MKRMFLLSFLLLGMGIGSVSQAQINVQVNLGGQPQWGPAGVSAAQYYYMPELNVYYNVRTSKYTYFKGNKWVTKSKLPGKYKKHNLFRTYKVVINQSTPWQYHERNHREYARYAKHYKQPNRRDAYRKKNNQYKKSKKQHHKHEKHRGRH